MAKESTAVVVEVTDEELAELQRMGGGAETTGVSFPVLKLQHTTDFNGDPNELRGKYTITKKDGLGNWITTDIGETLELQILMRRYRLYLKKGDTEYSTREFDSLMDVMPLTMKVGDDPANQKFSLHSQGDARTLQSAFMATNDEGVERSELKLLSVLYVKLGDEILKWKTNLSATMAYSQYAKTVNVFSVMTQATVKEMKSGSVKYYAPVLVAIRQLTPEEIKAAIEAQKGLREVFSLVSKGTVEPKALNSAGEELEALPEATDSSVIPF